MELREYMSIRRAYNLVRQSVPAKKRLTFEEFAILCRLALAGVPQKTSDIADYQDALRPTMTHRTNHLARLGLIDRGSGMKDKRNIVCSISDEGEEYVDFLCQKTCDEILSGQALSRTSPERVRRYVDAMGAVYCTASDLVLLGISVDPRGACSVTDLVARLGLLQPTVSMSVSSLVEDGCVQRRRDPNASNRIVNLTLTEEGRKEAEQLCKLVDGIVVRRRMRFRPA
ncbi:MAG: MarR family transcriptional regulator [Atopobiaceae bacterium]